MVLLIPPNPSMYYVVWHIRGRSLTTLSTRGRCGTGNVNGIQISPHYSIMEFLYQCQLMVDRWSIMGKIWSTQVKNDPLCKLLGSRSQVEGSSRTASRLDESHQDSIMHIPILSKKCRHLQILKDTYLSAKFSDWVSERVSWFMSICFCGLTK